MSERIKNIFQMLKKIKKNKEQDVVCISFSDNNEIIVNQTNYSYQNSIIENSLDSIIDNNNNNNNNNNDNNDNYISRSPSLPSFLSENSLSGSNFEEEYKEIPTLGLDLHSQNMDIDTDTDADADAKTKIDNAKSIQDTVNEPTNEPTNQLSKTTFNIQNKYNVVIDMSDCYWNYNTFLNFWRNTVGICSFFYQGQSCSYEDIVLNGYKNVYVI
jgi:hypothetical protein